MARAARLFGWLAVACLVGAAVAALLRSLERAQTRLDAMSEEGWDLRLRANRLEERLQELERPDPAPQRKRKGRAS